jgi:Ricin-type beta-trefoil lectin domain
MGNPIRAFIEREGPMKHQCFQTMCTLALGGALLGGALIVAGTAESYSQVPPTTKGAIYNSRSEKCLQPLNESTAQGAPIVLMPCDQRPAQQWKRLLNGGALHYVNQLSGMCLDAHGSAANGTPVQQWTCNMITNENWRYLQDAGDTQPKVVSWVSNTNIYCLDIPGGQTTSGLAVQIYTCNGTPAQHWYTP